MPLPEPSREAVTCTVPLPGGTTRLAALADRLVTLAAALPNEKLARASPLPWTVTVSPA
jgi:hypothetical protein